MGLTRNEIFLHDLVRVVHLAVGLWFICRSILGSFVLSQISKDYQRGGAHMDNETMDIP